MADKDTEIRRRLTIFFEQNQKMVQDYLDTYGSVLSLRYVQEIRDKYEGKADPFAQLEASVRSGQSQAEQENKGDPTFNITVDCPACKMWNLKHYELRAKSQIIKYDPFLMPVHTGHGEFYTVNFSNYAVTVCPRCFFASPDRNDFIVYSKARQETIPSRLSPALLSEIQDTMPERQCLLEESDATEELYQVPRDYKNSVLSYQLADMRAAKEAEYGHPFAYYKRGNYWLKIALLQRQNEVEDQSSLDNALKYLKEAFRRTDFPSPSVEYQTCYVIFMLLLKKGELKEARDYVGLMEKSKKTLEVTGSQYLAALNKWLDKAKFMWEEREQAYIWETPKTDSIANAQTDS
jgi:uncharacterized protein (DUF2225 family)